MGCTDESVIRQQQQQRSVCCVFGYIYTLADDSQCP